MLDIQAFIKTLDLAGTFVFAISGAAVASAERAAVARERSETGPPEDERMRRTTVRWCRLPDSNGGPTAYKAVALPTELSRRGDAV